MTIIPVMITQLTRRKLCAMGFSDSEINGLTPAAAWQLLNANGNTPLGEYPLLDAALSYAARGWKVLPLHTPNGGGGCDCGKANCGGKHPRTEKGKDDATNDLTIVRKWWEAWPDANIGLLCGEASGGALAIDFENETVYRAWRDEVGEIADSLVIQTTGRGYHVILRCDDPGANEKLARTADGKTLIETRANGGYIMAAPSLHPNGKNYQLIQGTFTAVSHVGMADVDRLLLAAHGFDQTPNDEPPNPLAFLVKSVVEITSQPPRPADWLTYKFIECGELVLFTAPGGNMKSLFMLDWAISLASGQNWLTLPNGNGGRITKAATVLWLNTDNPETTHAERLWAVLSARGVRDVPLFSLTTTEFDLANPEHIKHLHLLADEVGASVIVIDTLSGALTGIEENSAKEMTLPAAHLRALASDGRTVIGLHHPPKNDVNGSRGSSVLPNKADRVYSLSRDGDLLTVKNQKERGRPAQLFTAIAALDSDPITEALLSVRFFDGQAIRQEREDDELKARIREALQGEEGGMNLTKLSKACHCRLSELRSALFNMRRRRVVEEKDGPRNAKLYKLVSK